MSRCRVSISISSLYNNAITLPSFSLPLFISLFSLYCSNENIIGTSQACRQNIESYDYGDLIHKEEPNIGSEGVH